LWKVLFESAARICRVNVDQVWDHEAINSPRRAASAPPRTRPYVKSGT